MNFNSPFGLLNRLGCHQPYQQILDSCFHPQEIKEGFLVADLIKHLIFSHFVVLNELQSAHPLFSPVGENKNLKSVGKVGDSLSQH